MDPQPAGARGSLQFGDHDVIRLIAKGGMGAVYEVENVRTGVHYAAKTIKKPDDARHRARFEREAELMARCDRHPGIVKVHFQGTTPEGALYIIFDLVRGEDLDHLIWREKKLDPSRAAALARDVGHALGFVHERGIAHRDVKPSNILLDSEAGGAPRLADFGLATARDMERLTRTGAFVGTPHYTSPEQAQGKGEVRSDVFSLGAVLFHMLTGTTPVEGDSGIQILQRLGLDEPIRDVRELEPSCPDALAAIVAKALEKPPERRYESGGSLARDLDRFLSGEPVLALEERRAEERARRRRSALAYGSIGLLLVVAAVAGGALLARRDKVARALAEARGAALEARDAIDGVAVALVDTRTGEEREARARKQVALARSKAARALALGADPASGLLAAADELEPRLAAALGSRSLAAGDPERALRVVGAAPPSPVGRLVRSRALLALLRPKEAEEEAEALEGSLAEPERAEAEEILGDALMAQGSFAKAAAAYSRALASRPSVRVKRGAASALSGDDATALADLASLVPDLGRLPAERSENRALASFAGPLYRRGLASSGAAAAHDVDLASCLAAPPPELSARLQGHWRRRLDALDRRPESRMVSSGSLPREDLVRWLDVVHEVVLLRRRIFELDQDREALDRFLSDLGFWAVHLQAWGPIDDAIALVDKLRTAWPDEPELIYICAFVRFSRPTPAEARDGVELYLLAAEHLRRANDHETEAERELAKSVARDALDKLSQFPFDPGRLVNAAEIAGDPELWSWLAEAFSVAGNRERALELLARAEDPRQGPVSTISAFWIAQHHGEILAREDPRAAVRWARERYATAPTSENVAILAELLQRVGENKEVVALLSAAQLDKEGPPTKRAIQALVRAEVELDDLDGARSALARYRTSGATAADVERLSAEISARVPARR